MVLIYCVIVNLHLVHVFVLFFTLKFPYHSKALQLFLLGLPFGLGSCASFGGF